MYQISWLKEVREAYTDLSGRLTDVFMDRYYFKHLRLIDRTMNQGSSIKSWTLWLIWKTSRCSCHKAKAITLILNSVLSSTVDKTLLIDEVLEKAEGSWWPYRSCSILWQVCCDFRTGRTSSLCIKIVKRKNWFIAFWSDFWTIGPLAKVLRIHALEMEVKTCLLLRL